MSDADNRVGLEQFYLSRRLARASVDCLTLPAAKNTSITIEYARLPDKFDAREQSFSSLFNKDHTAKLEPLSNLSKQQLSALTTAGYDVPALKYSLSVLRYYVIPRPEPIAWHTEAGLRLEAFRSVMQRGIRILRTVASDICPTVTAPVTLFKEYPEFTHRELLYFCKIKAYAGDRSGSWQRAIEESCARSKTGANSEKIIAEISESAEQARLNSVISNQPSTVHFDYITPHALTCNPPRGGNAPHLADYVPGSQKRHRVILTIHAQP